MKMAGFEPALTLMLRIYNPVPKPLSHIIKKKSGARFELAVYFYIYVGFQDRCLKPLSHPTKEGGRN
jgi:hypothetical protein